MAFESDTLGLSKAKDQGFPEGNTIDHLLPMEY